MASLVGTEVSPSESSTVWGIGSEGNSVTSMTRVWASVIALPLSVLVAGCSPQSDPVSSASPSISVVRQAEGVQRDWFRDLTTADFEAVTKGYPGLYVVLARNDNCRPCNDMARSIYSTENIEPPIGVGVVDIDQSPEIADSLGITAIPTTLIYRNGAVVARQQGALSTRQFLDWIRPYVAGS
jgi:thioredoxin-like negative regulator of GroEL